MHENSHEALGVSQNGSLLHRSRVSNSVPPTAGLCWDVDGLLLLPLLQVCLSLLGTFSSGGATERWNPATSSLFQVGFFVASHHLNPVAADGSLIPFPLHLLPKFCPAEDRWACGQRCSSRHSMVGRLPKRPSLIHNSTCFHLLTLIRWRLRQGAGRLVFA